MANSIEKFLNNLRETRFTTFSHELRVFIYGADVTPWLKGDLSITYGNRDSFNSCVLEISNPRKIWQLTKTNLSVGTDGIVKEHFRLSAGVYSEKEKYEVFKWKNSSNINPAFTLSTSSIYLGSTTNVPDEIQTAKGKAGSAFKLPTSDTAERRYRLAVNDCIFNRQDPIRIFMRNPYSSEGNEWVEIFCGFVYDSAVTTNHLTGESSVRISGYCIRQLMTKMRVQMQPLLTMMNPEPLFTKDLFADFMRPSMGSHPFPNTSLESTIKTLILGTDVPKTGKANLSIGGIGEFKLGNIVCYDPDDPADTLEKWHLLTVFGVNKVANPSVSSDLWLTTKEMETIGKSTLTDPSKFSYSPAGRYLHFLLPIGGTGAGALVQSRAVGDYGLQIEWTNRWEIIKDFASKLDFQVLTSPSGDILVEFPMYGFTPHLFVNQNSTPTSEINTSVIPSRLGGMLTFDLHQIEETLSDEAEDFDTIIQVDGGNAQQETQVPNDGSPVTSIRAYVWSTALVSRYGPITGQLSIPFSGQRSSEDGDSHQLRLARLGILEYTKRLANSSLLDGTVVYRPFLFPNRPIWIKQSSRIGVATSVTYRWSIGKSASTTFSLNMLMAERYEQTLAEMGKNPSSWRLPTGSSNSPIDYANIWAKDDISSPTAGIFAQVGTEHSKPNIPTNGQTEVTQNAANAAKQRKAQNTAQYALDDPNYMYQPFAKSMQNAIENAERAGYNIVIKSTYRDPQFQQWLKDNPDKRAKTSSGHPVQAAEPWRSSHQYGMAVDLKINGSKDYNIYKEFFTTFCDREVIYWGGAYNDYVHFEWKIPGTSGGDTSILANRYRLASPYANSTDNSYLQEVWKQFDARGTTYANVVSNAQLPPLPSSSLDITSAPKCTPSYLQDSDTGLKQLAST